MTQVSEEPGAATLPTELRVQERSGGELAEQPPQQLAPTVWCQPSCPAVLPSPSVMMCWHQVLCPCTASTMEGCLGPCC